MSTRAELEAELKETQELERYMNTLLDDRIRQCEHLEFTNAALTKRVAELEARLRFTADSLRSLSPGPHHGPMDAEEYVPLITKRVAELERFAKPGSYWFTRATDLESQLETKGKRVAELETLTADCHDVMVTCKRRESELREQIADLQSQLEAKDKRVAELEARLLQLNVCWHCHDCILPAPKPRCEHCPDECDVEGCDAPGCLEHSAPSRIELPKEGER